MVHRPGLETDTVKQGRPKKSTVRLDQTDPRQHSEFKIVKHAFCPKDSFELEYMAVQPVLYNTSLFYKLSCLEFFILEKW